MPISRVNLCLRPALKFPGAGAPGWDTNGVSPNWGRITTGVHATLPRTTAIAGTTALAAMYCAIAPVTPGRTYVGSIHFRFIAASSGTVCMTWCEEDGNTVVAQSAGVAFSQAANTTARLSTGAVVAPPGAVTARVTIQSIDGSAQATGCLVEEGSSLGTYFDGDTSGARWTEADGTSYSAIGASALAGTAEYDDDRGRVRMFASGLASPAGRVRVSRRGATRAVFETVRGGDVPASGGIAARSADDYEYPDLDGGLIYRFATYGSEAPLAVGGIRTGAVEPAIETFEVAFTPPQIRAWLKFCAAPRLNRKITITDWDPIERPARNQLYDVDGRTDPIVVTSGHSSRRTSLKLRTWTRAETDALDEALRQGIPGFLHLPRSQPDLASMYVVFGAYRWRAPSRRSQGAVFTLPLIEVAAPPASIFATGATWQSVLDGFATWQAFADSATEWRRVTS